MPSDAATAGNVSQAPLKRGQRPDRITAVNLAGIGGGRVLRHRVRLGGFDAVARLVGAGAGAAVMPEKAATRYRDAGTRVLPLSDPWAHRRLLICITPQGAELNTVRALVDALLASPPGA